MAGFKAGCEGAGVGVSGERDGGPVAVGAAVAERAGVVGRAEVGRCEVGAEVRGVVGGEKVFVVGGDCGRFAGLFEVGESEQVSFDGGAKCRIGRTYSCCDGRRWAMRM